MKKIVGGLALSVVMASVGLAGTLTGKIERLVAKNDGSITVQINGANKIITSETTGKKMMYATLLTAQSADKTVQIKFASGEISTVVIYTTPPAP